MTYLLLAGLCFCFSAAGYYIGAQQDDAEKELQDVTAANWAALGDALGSVDYYVFLVLVVLEPDLWWAAALTTAPASAAGAWVGERWSVRQNWVRNRIRKAKKRAALAEPAPPA